MLGKVKGCLIKSLNKEEGERLRGDGDQVKWIKYRFETSQIVGLMN